MGNWYSSSSAVAPEVPAAPPTPTDTYPTLETLQALRAQVGRCHRKHCARDLHQRVLEAIAASPRQALTELWPKVQAGSCRHYLNLQLRLLEAIQAKISP